ncbi:hypothetical protein [Parageobacillus galactosidasius]|uniref:hypothetical protein n=1 Tax=Parageobacillus galactosidasius TaxID=883812 RepID=UPI001FEAED63|nr:hypothetical protein [Parageobacillus galactosidasius]
MKTVREMKIVSHDETQLYSLDELMRVFGSAKLYEEEVSGNLPMMNRFKRNESLGLTSTLTASP